MNQAAVISGPLRGYGAPHGRPGGDHPADLVPVATGKAGDPFPYNPAKAKSLLTSHGWKVVPDGVSHLREPGQVRARDQEGHRAQLQLPVRDRDVLDLTSEMTQLQSNAAAIGIKLNLQPKPFNQVTALAAGNCVVAKLSCKWDMANYGVGWSFAPDYLPTGDELFQTGAVANSGGYSQQDQRRADPEDPDQRRQPGHVQLAGLPGHPAADDVAAQRRPTR